jgi:PAS domain S-box-containing protein
VLLVEDQAIIALATATRIRDTGYEVETAGSGQAALAAVESAAAADHPFDLILMDIDLGPGMDGVEAARQILTGHRVPIIFLTAHAEPEYIDRVRKVTRYGYVLKSSGDLILRLSMEMALDLFDAHEEVILRERQLETVLAHAPVAMLIVDENYRLLRSNARGEAMSKMPEAKMVGTKIGAVLRCIHALNHPGGCGSSPHCSNCPLRRMVRDSLDHGLNHDEERIRLPVADRRRSLTMTRNDAPQPSVDSEARYRLLLENVHAVPWEYSIAKDEWTYVAPQVTDILGYSPEEWTDYPFWLDRLHPEDRGWASDYCDACSARGESHVFEYRFRAKNGEYLWLRDVVTVEMAEGKPAHLRGFMIDITDRKRTEDEVARLAEEKAVLLRELTHRVKNNLATLDSLLSLQMQQANDPPVLEALGSARLRLRTVQTVYDLLHNQYREGLGNAAEYLGSLTEQLTMVLPHEKRVRLELNAEPLHLSSDTLLPLGIITNELISNSVKYAFPGNRAGVIRVSLTREGTGNARLMVSDNGVGMDGAQAAIANPSGGLGLTLVRSLAEQIRGQSKIDTGSHGTHAEISFSIPKAE